MYQTFLFDVPGFILFTLIDKTNSLLLCKYRNTMLHRNKSATARNQSRYQNDTPIDKLLTPLKCLYRYSKVPNLCSTITLCLMFLSNLF